jgi:uncharacterized protein (TIGR03032 family)
VAQHEAQSAVNAARHPEALWSEHNGEWRDPMQVISHWREASDVDPRLLRYRARGRFFETLARLGVTLLVTREYEHLLMALSTHAKGKPSLSYLRLPHPSGLVADRKHARVHVACTRNPNQVFDLEPVTSILPRLDMRPPSGNSRPLLPARSRFLPGSTYLHDLALIGNELYANAVGHNAVVRIDRDGRAEYAWWPRCIEDRRGRPLFTRNHIQLNSIAAGKSLEASFFSASTYLISARRPGHRHFPVDKRGVIFSGKTREPMVTGLTRPHSARLYAKQLWVDNSGYGELGRIVRGQFEPVCGLPGWTRGLCFVKDVAFVGSSRVIPRFRQYAPGLDVSRSECAVWAVDVKRGIVLGSLAWPFGNQIFALDWLPAETTSGFPFQVGRKRATSNERSLFYSFQLAPIAG